MTDSEKAIGQLKFMLKQMPEEPPSECDDTEEWFDTDRKIRSAFRMAIKALEKDIPKAPKKSDIPRYGMGYEYYDWYCPTCNIFLAYECDEERQHIYRCERCGQRLDWTKSEV